MKTKIGTVLDAGLLRQARSMAAREGKRLNQVLEEALTDHLKRKSAGARGESRRAPPNPSGCPGDRSIGSAGGAGDPRRITLADIEEGAAVFVDANVFIYHFVGASEDCTALLRRCEIGEVEGSTSALVLAEACHRLMMIEAVERRLVAPGNVARKLARRPDVVRQLAFHDASIQAIPAMGIEIVGVRRPRSDWACVTKPDTACSRTTRSSWRPCNSAAYDCSRRLTDAWRRWTKSRSAFPLICASDRNPSSASTVIPSAGDRLSALPTSTVIRRPAGKCAPN